MKIKLNLLTVTSAIVIIGYLYYIINKLQYRNIPSIEDIKSDENIIFKKIFDVDSLYMGEEIEVIKTNCNHNSRTRTRRRKILLKDSENNVYFFTSQGYDDERILYKITDDFNYEKADLKDIDSLSPLYYTIFIHEDIDYVKRNGGYFLNEDSPKPTSKLIRKELYIKYFKRNISKIICFSINPSDCNPSSRYAEFKITIPLQDQNIELKNLGTVGRCYLNVYYINNLKTDDLVFISNGTKTLWVAKLNDQLK